MHLQNKCDSKSDLQRIETEMKMPVRGPRIHWIPVTDYKILRPIGLKQISIFQAMQHDKVFLANFPWGNVTGVLKEICQSD